MKYLSSFLKSIFSPLFSLILIVSSSAPFMTFISIKLNSEGVSNLILGFVHASFYIGFLIGSLKAERLIKRIGYIRSFAALACLYMSAIMFQGMFINPYLWMLMRLLSGISIASLYIVIESWLLMKSSVRTRGKIMALYMIAVYGSQSMSQLFVQFMPVHSLWPFLFVGFLGSLSIFPVAVTYTKSPEIIENYPKKKFREICKLAPLGLIGCFTAGLILSAIYSFIPSFANAYHISPSYIMTITIAGGFLLQWPIGYLSDIFNRRSVLVVTSFSIIIPSLLIILFLKNISFVLIMSFILGGCCFTIYPLSITQVCDKIDPIYTTYATSILSCIYGIDSILGPVISPIFMDVISPSAIYLYIMLCGVLLGVLGIVFKVNKIGVSLMTRKKKIEYVPMPATPIASKELDVRVSKSKNVDKEK